MKSIHLILLLTLHMSCLEKPSTAEENIRPVSVATSKSDILKFTSGIRSIFQDSKGNHWFGSLQEGVARFDGKSFHYFTHHDGLTDNQIHHIQEVESGVIWFNTQRGVSSYDGTQIVDHTSSYSERAQTHFPMQRGEPLPGEWMKLENDLWFEAGVQEGVYRLDGNKLHYLEFPPHKILNPTNNLFAVTSISKGKGNRIWFGTYAGIFGYDGKGFTIINDETLGFDRAIARLHIRSVFEDSKGRLWIGNNGIGVLLKEGDSILNFSSKHHLIHPFSKRNGDKSPPGTLEHVFVIAEDNKGNIWFGDRDAGIWKYDGKNMVNYTRKDGLTHDFALAIYEDHDGKLWFGMADGNVYQFNGKNFEKQF